MKEIRNIIDAWRVIEKYSIRGWVTKNDNIILVPESEYERVFNAAKYKHDIVRLLPENGGFFGGGGRFTIC